MTDTLHRAWNVLEPGERPEGLDVINTQWHDSLGRVLPEAIDPRVAYDRLVVAVEGVLLDKCALHHMHGVDGCHHWGDPPNADWSWKPHGTPDPDRLTAAVLALESERGSDA